MAVLTPEHTRRLTHLMDARLAREMDEIRSVTARVRDARDGVAPADWIDAALANSTLASDDAVLGQDAQDVRDIIAAHTRLSAGTYGICVDCGEAIVYARLLAYPTAKRCVHCQRLHEQGGAREGNLRSS